MRCCLLLETHEEEEGEGEAREAREGGGWRRGFPANDPYSSYLLPNDFFTVEGNVHMKICYDYDPKDFLLNLLACDVLPLSLFFARWLCLN